MSKMKCGQKDMCSKCQVVKMKSGDKWSKLKVAKMKSGHNKMMVSGQIERWSKLKLVNIKNILKMDKKMLD